MADRGPGGGPLSAFTHVFLCDDPSPHAGGIQNMAYWISREVAARGYRTAVAGRMDGEAVAAAREAGVVAVPFRKALRSRLTSDLRLLVALLRLRGKYGRDVLLYSMLINNLRMVRRLRPILGWRCVSFLYGNDVLRLSRKRPAVLAANVSACLCVAAISRYTRAVAERVARFPNLVVIPPGIPVPPLPAEGRDEARRRLGWDGRKVVLMLSRLNRRKGHSTVLRAAARLRGRHPGILVAIAGTGGYRERIEALSRELGLGEAVRFLGAVPEEEKGALLAAADLFCMPSDADEGKFEVEGFGIVFLEAAAAGTLCVGSDTGGIPDALEDGRSGILVPAGDAEALAEALDRALSDPAAFDAVRLHARERAVGEFSWPRRTEELLSAVEGALEAAPRGSAGGAPPP